MFGDQVLEDVVLAVAHDREINAFASSDGKAVQVNVATAELIADSDSELGFVVAFEVAHILQIRTGRLLGLSTNRDADAGVAAALLVMAAGYDPYAAGGVFGKLQMISGQSGIFGQQYREFATNPGKPLNGQLSEIFNGLMNACTAAMPRVGDICGAYKSVAHPHLPGALPLRVRPTGRK